MTLGTFLFPRGKMVPVEDGQPVRGESEYGCPGPWAVRTVHSSTLGRLQHIFGAMFGLRDDEEYYGSFWYSLDLFAPVIDLGIARAWTPHPRAYPWLLVWMQVTAVIGVGGCSPRARCGDWIYQVKDGEQAGIHRMRALDGK